LTVVANKLVDIENDDCRLVALTQDEAQVLWQELDIGRYGSISANMMQRWLEDSVGFNLPITEAHYLYDVFGTSERQGIS
jgi:hypothetical protein